MSAKLLYAVLTEQRLKLPDTAADLRGRVLIITGANSGLGFASAKRFYAMHPAHLILAVRTISKGEAAKEEIIASGTGSSATKVDVWELDLASFDSVRAFGRRCESELERLDILVENGGFIPGKLSITKDGWEGG
jgi:retinol dehydrogenase 12